MPRVDIPSSRQRIGKRHPLWWLPLPEPVGSLVRSGGVWSLVQTPLDEDTREGVLRGGFLNIVDDLTAEELIRDGFGDWLIYDDESGLIDFTTDFTTDFR